MRAEEGALLHAASSYISTRNNTANHYHPHASSDIMASPELTARLKHLDGAARLLADTAPEISRHLMLKHNALMFDKEIDMPNERRKHVCGACGTIIKPQVNGKLETKPKARKKAATKAAGHARTSSSKQCRVRLYTCKICDRYTRTISHYPAGIRHHRQHTPADTEASPTVTTVSKPTDSARPHTIATKKSKSARKGGLSALLAQQKSSQSNSSGFGLNLLDFMKKS